MKVFDHPNTANDWKCPICETNVDEPVTLIPISGTENDGVVEAEQIHIDCILSHLVLHRDTPEVGQTVIGFAYKSLVVMEEIIN